jgi:hypothetical protein
VSTLNYKKILTNLSFWSAISGFVGALLTTYYGLPTEIHADGHRNLILEQVDQNQIHMAIIYGVFSKIGLGLIAVSFLLQLIGIIKNSSKKKTP